MEIHAPDHPITSWKDTVKHLAIITAGVLIALALEGAVAWIDHRLLVREAIANLTAEIQANRKELDGMFASFQLETKDLAHADEIAVLLLKHTPQSKMELHLSTHAAELKNAAVTTGEITGAFGYMDYKAVRRYADVYDFQAQYLRLQERDGQNFAAILGFVPRVADSAPPPDAAIEQWRDRIGAAAASIYLREQMARQLIKRYDDLLTSSR